MLGGISAGVIFLARFIWQFTVGRGKKKISVRIGEGQERIFNVCEIYFHF